MKHILIITLLALCSGCYGEVYRVPAEYVDFKCAGGKVQMLFDNPDHTRTWYSTEKPCNSEAWQAAKRVNAEKEKQ
jgi:hypothetical protein